MALLFEMGASLSCSQCVFVLAFIPGALLRIFWGWRWYLRLKVSSPLDLIIKKKEFSGKKQGQQNSTNIFFLLLIFDYSPLSVALAVHFTSECLHAEFHQCGAGSKDATFLLKISLIPAPVTHKWRLYWTFSSPHLSSLSPLLLPTCRPLSAYYLLAVSPLSGRSSLISLPPSAVLLLSLWPSC